MTEARAEGVEYVNIDVETGIIIQSLMFRNRHQQKDLAPIVGVSPSTLSKKLRGAVAFSLAELYRIARAYDVDPGDLLPRLDSNQQPCGYPQSLVSDVDKPTWDRLFDRCASGESRAGTPGAPSLPWRDWVNTGWVGRSAYSTAELRDLVDAWDRDHGFSGTRVPTLDQVAVPAP